MTPLLSLAVLNRPSGLFALLALAGLVTALPAWSDDDIPGTVVVDDENELEDEIAFSALAATGRIGHTENWFSCDLQDGDAECTATTVDEVDVPDLEDSAVVAVTFHMHQFNLLSHKGPEAFAAQKKLVVEILVFDNPIDMELIGQAKSLVSSCLGEMIVKDVDGDDTQDVGKWKIGCSKKSLVSLAKEITASEVSGNGELARAAATLLFKSSAKDGSVFVKGIDKNGPSVMDSLLDAL